jgi:hypothetical protein
VTAPLPEDVNPDGDLPSALRRLEDAVIALIDEPLKLAGRHDCTSCHNETCEHDCTLHTCPGHLTPTDSLYVQLRDAVEEGRSGGSQGASRPRSLPTGWIDAQKVLDEIDFAVSLWQPGHNEDPTPTVGRLNHMLRLKYRPQDVHGLDQKSEALVSWVKDINDLFDPPKVKHLSAPCPACGATTAHRKDSAGEVVRVPALQIIAEIGCTCQACRYTWSPEYYVHLCRVLGFELPAGVLE